MLPDGNLEVVLVDPAIGEGLAEIPFDTRGAGNRARDAESPALLRGDDPDAHGPILEDGVAVEQLFVFTDPLPDLVDEGLDVVFPTVGEVGGHATGPDVVVVHPQTGRLLEEIEDVLPIAETVDEHRDGAEVGALGGGPDQVAGDPVQLGHEHPDRLGTLGYLDAQQRFDRQRESQLHVQRRQVVHPGDVGGALHVGQRLTGLLHAGMEVPDDRLDPADRLPVQLELETEHAMGGGMLRAHVEDLELVRIRGLFEFEVVVDNRAPGQP